MSKTENVITLTSTTTIEAYAKATAQKYHLGPLFIETLRCESAGWQNIQSEVVKNGVREQSYGIAQINLPSHHDVTMAQAMNPQWAIDWAAKAFATGKEKNKDMWTCYRNLVSGSQDP